MDDRGRVIAGTTKTEELPTTVVDGERVYVRQFQSPLPQRLDQLMSSLLAVTFRADLRPTGALATCTQRQVHDMTVLRVGRLLGSDAVLRDVRVEMCRHCGAACVRDISYDPLGAAMVGSGMAPGRRGRVRRDLILGWYSGARPSQREYR